MIKIQIEESGVKVFYPDNFEDLTVAQRLDLFQDALAELKSAKHFIKKEFDWLENRYWRDVMWQSVKVKK